MPPRKRYQKRQNMAKKPETENKSKAQHSAPLNTPAHEQKASDNTHTNNVASHDSTKKNKSYWPTSNNAYVLIESRAEDLPTHRAHSDNNDTLNPASSVSAARQTSKPRWPTSNTAYVLIATNKGIKSRAQDPYSPHVSPNTLLDDSHGALGVAASLNAVFGAQDTMPSRKVYAAKTRQPLQKNHVPSPPLSQIKPLPRSGIRKAITSLPPSSPPTPLSPSHSAHPDPPADVDAELEEYDTDESDPFGFGAAEQKLRLQRKVHSEKAPSTPQKKPGASSSMPSTPSPIKSRFVRDIPGSASTSHGSRDEHDSIQAFDENSGAEEDVITEKEEEEEEESESPPSKKKPLRRPARGRRLKPAEKLLDPRTIVKNLEALLPKRPKRRQADRTQASSSAEGQISTPSDSDSDIDDKLLRKRGPVQPRKVAKPSTREEKGTRPVNAFRETRPRESQQKADTGTHPRNKRTAGPPAEEDQPLKRLRGRPRKESPEPVSVGESLFSESTQIKKLRARPRKVTDSSNDQRKTESKSRQTKATKSDASGQIKPREARGRGKQKPDSRTRKELLTPELDSEQTHEREQRLEYFHRLNNYSVPKENVYVV